MIKRYKFAIEPLVSQENSLAKAFGHSRFVYNHALSSSKGSYPGLARSSRDLTQLKKTDGFKWLNQVSCVPLQQSLRNLDKAYQNFFESIKGTRKGKKVNLPRFKSRKSKQSITFTQRGFRLKKQKLYLAKIGLIKVRWSRELPNYPTSVTIEKTKSGKYFASFVCEVEPRIAPESDNAVGIDLGIKHFAVLSNGEKVSAPKPLRENLRKLKRLQRDFSRTQKGSKRRERKRISLAKLHQHISNIRLDFLHKLSTRLAQENQLICLEDLNVSGMLKNRKLSRSISDLGLGAFKEMLISKAEEFERKISIISRWFPSSKKCSTCGEINSNLTLGDRCWTCKSCRAVHDRDINAAINILHEGLRLVAGGHSETLNEHGENVRLYNLGCKAVLSEVLTPISDKAKNTGSLALRGEESLS